jgi:hypothetical protein
MLLALRIVSILCGLLALFGIRRAYVAYIALGLLYFPLQVGFRFHPQGCQLAISPGLALMSLTNWGHIVLFGIFYVMTIAQFRSRSAAAFAWSALIVIVMGAAVEVAEGVTGARNCRLRDLVPDAAGAAIGMAVLGAISAGRR